MKSEGRKSYNQYASKEEYLFKTLQVLKQEIIIVMKEQYIKKQKISYKRRK